MQIHKDERLFTVDPRLNELASLVADIKFELTVEDIDQYNFLFQGPGLKNVTFCRDKVTHRVRFFLGGKQRVLGLHRVGASAAIYADCARLFFWPYRLRDIRPPNDGDFNYSLVRAQEMLISHDTLGSHLEAIHKHLANFGDLREANPSDDAQRKQRKQIRESRRTVKAELRQLLADQMGEIAANREAVTDLTQTVKESFEQLKQAFHHILERLDKLESRQTGGAPANKPLES